MSGTIVCRCVGCDKVRKVSFDEARKGAPSCEDCFSPMVAVKTTLRR